VKPERIDVKGLAGRFNVHQDNPIKKNSGRKNAWLRVFFIGLLLFFAGFVIMVITGNPNLFPTVVMIGNFLVPVTFVAFIYERRHLSRLSLRTTALSFFYGGVLGVLASAIFEPIFIRQLDPASMFVVGLIEEFAKILGVLVIARHWKHDAEMDGLILGGAAGLGFAALESNGYAFSAFLFSGGSLSLTVGVTMLRGILAPLGHGVWTAILASVLFRESRGNHFRLNWKVLSAYLTVAVLHGLWDTAPTVIAYFLSQGLDVFVGQSVIAGAGLLILWRRWREARRLQDDQERMLENAQYVDRIPAVFNQVNEEVES
jgi:RsiW-degrading membrane proteinase PrsW (M82 family)